MKLIPPACLLDCMVPYHINTHNFSLSYFGAGLYFACRLCLSFGKRLCMNWSDSLFTAIWFSSGFCFSLPFSQSFCYWAVVWKYWRDCRPYKISSPMTTVPIVLSFVCVCVCRAIVGRFDCFFIHLKPFNAFALTSLYSFSHTLWTVISPTRIDKQRATKHFAVVIKCFKVHIFMPMFKN